MHLEKGISNAEAFCGGGQQAQFGQGRMIGKGRFSKDEEGHVRAEREADAREFVSIQAEPPERIESNERRGGNRAAATQARAPGDSL